MQLNLNKNDIINLNKTAGKTLTKVVMGLGWDTRKGFLGRSISIDLDASCLMFEGDRLVDSIWFRQLNSRDGSVRHTGDNLTGDGDGDDEQIIVDLSNVSPNVDRLVFTVNSFTGDTFDKVENAFCRLVDATTNDEIARFNLTESGSHTGQVMASVFKGADGWNMKAIGKTSKGRTFNDMMPAILAA